MKTPTAEELPELSEGLIAVENGILDIHTWELKPFSPEFFVVNSFPVIYNPEADSPKFKTFLNEVGPEARITPASKTVEPLATIPILRK